MNENEVEIKFKRNVKRQIQKLLLLDEKIIEFDKVK
jgi:hypothetical protein